MSALLWCASLDINIAEAWLGKLTYKLIAGWTDKQRGDYFPPDDGFVKLVRHEPLGYVAATSSEPISTLARQKMFLAVNTTNSVCVAINPYNSPVASFMLKAAPCLATGNVLIVKPSEKSPLGSLAVAGLFEEAGFPKGVVQVLSGDGSTGALLTSHMRVRKVSLNDWRKGNSESVLTRGTGQLYRQCQHRQEDSGDGGSK